MRDIGCQVTVDRPTRATAKRQTGPTAKTSRLIPAPPEVISEGADNRYHWTELLCTYRRNTIMTTDLMNQHRRRGKCSDPVGKCQFRDQDVDLYNGCCRPCYDRLRNSNPKSKTTMPDLSPPPQNAEEKDLHKAKSSALRLPSVAARHCRSIDM